MKKIFFTILTLITGISTITAQYDAQLSNYWSSIGYFNPANAGRSGDLEATALYRMQWIGVEGAPQTGLITADMPFYFLGRTHGLGAVMYSEKIGLFDRMIFSGQYAYKKELWKGTFSAGIQLGYISEKFRGAELANDDIKDEYHQGAEADDGIPETNISGSGIDAAFGLMYYKPKWYVGLSVTHLTSPTLELDENTVMEVPRAYYLTAGYNIQLKNPLLELRPAILLKTTEMGSPVVSDSIPGNEGSDLKAMMKMTQLDLSVRLVYNKMFWGGLGWRKDDAAVISLGGKFKMIEAGYAYDFPISTMLKGSTGSHELFIKYIVDLSKKKGNRNKHKSVRIL